MLSWIVLIQFLKEVYFFVSFVSSNSFPQPLSSEDEKKYLLKFAEGDSDARSKLITHNLRLVAHIVKKYENKYDDTDDLISLGTIGLIKAVETYKIDRGTRLATYAARCIENEILMHLRATKKNHKDIYLCEPIGVDKEGNEITLIDILPDGAQRDVCETVSLNIESSQLIKALPCMPKRERDVLIMRYGLFRQKRHTQKEVSQKLGISRSYVSRIEKKAIKKLAEIMSKLPSL